jgi:hypothetical protein
MYLFGGLGKKPHLELLQQAQGQVLFGGIARIGWWFREALRFGDTWLFEGLFLFVPGTKLRSRLLEGKPDRDGDFRGHQHQKDQALSPEIAPTFLHRAVCRDARAYARLSSAGCPYRR